MNNQETVAQIIDHPAMGRMRIQCCSCLLEGTIVTYNRFVGPLLKARFWCERCKVVNPGHVNIDLTQCEELIGAPIIPMRVIMWEVATKPS